MSDLAQRAARIAKKYPKVLLAQLIADQAARIAELERDALIWNHTGIPAIPQYTDRSFIVAVRRDNGKVFTFPAVYCNQYPAHARCAPKAREGNGWKQELAPDDIGDEGDILMTGWYDERSDDEYGSTYEPMLGDGDALIAWAAIPSYREF
ncbi:hypothetical protein [Hydrocarboniphaga effusa]|uniref:hypothetical protein n=1 Tax=Hydrocarboniphaga effusa TaxID=243629 RepID=UPI00398C1969